MSNLGDILRERAAARSSPRSETVRPPVPALEFSFHSDSTPVGMSEDLKRILALPRRSPEPPPGIAERLTAELRRPGGTMTLWPHQAFALDEIRSTGNLLGALGTGFGKSLLSLLAPTVLDARVSILLVPSALKRQTVEKFYPLYAPQWRLPNLHGSSIHYPDARGILYVVSYSSLSSVRGASSLDDLQPDCIIMDECHAVSNTSAARTKRFRRYCNQARASGQLKHVIGLSGSMLSRRVKNTAGLSKIIHRRGSPFPLEYHTLEAWSEALDPSPEGDEREPGELARLCKDNESTRSGFRRRLIETPGVVATSEASVGTSLVFHERSVAVPPEVSKALYDMQQTWVTPTGDEITDALTLWRHAREIAAGVCLRWVWPRQEPLELRQEWMECRRNYNREVREFLTHRAGPNMDSPLLLARAAVAGKWNSAYFADWSRIHKACRPETEAVWISDFLVEDAVAWGSKTPGIIWYSIDAVGREIAKRGGFELYGPQAEWPRNIFEESGRKTIVASVESAGTGQELQMFHRSLFTSTMTKAHSWEQAVARCHRPGQEEDQVDVYVYRHGPYADAFRTAIADAKFVEETMGTRQRLLFADMTFTP